MPAAHNPVRWWFAGADPDALLVELERHSGRLTQDPDSNRNGSSSDTNGSDVPPRADGSIVAGSGPARLGIVDPNERKLRLARRLVAKGKPWRGRSDIWFSRAGLASAGGKIAFLFPGVEPTFEADAADVPSLARQLGRVAPTLEDTTIAHRSAAIYGLGIFLDEVLQALGIRPDVIAGHSIGEWSGTVAAGIVPRERASELVAATDLNSIPFPEVDFAALAAGVRAVGAVVDTIDGVDISHDNSPRQAVICGPPDRVDVGLDRLRAEGILGYRLAFRSGFHTPAVAPLVEVFREDAERLPFGPAEVPMWSATTVAPYPDRREDIMELHLRHLVEPVRFRELVERLYQDAGARIFVQVGLGSLTGFVDQTLDGADHLTIPLLTTKRSALAQMHRAITALWVEGVETNVDALEQSSAESSPRGGTVPGSGVRPGPGADANDAAPTETETADRAEAAAPVALAAPASEHIDVATLTAAADLLSAAAAASRDVVEALAGRLNPQPAMQTADLAAAQVPALPLDESPTASLPGVHRSTSWPAEPCTLTRRLSLETMPETLDHRLFELPEDWPDPTDGFPIVAMTSQIQLLQDLAAEQAPGRDVVEVFGIRNTRWLDLSDPQDVDITIAPKGDDVLAMALGRSCRANVRVGIFDEVAPPANRQAIVPELTLPRTPDHTPEQMFSQRLMFHGPRFWGITSLGPIGDNGMAAEFHQLDTPGSLLDNLGKIIAYWVMDRRGLGEAALPIGVEKIQFFGPDPAPGTAVHCDIRIVDLQPDGVTADGVLVLPDGSVWCRVERWSSIVFHRDEVMEPQHYDPTHRHLTEPQPGSWTVALERWPSGPGRELTARRYLSRAEREPFGDMNLVQQRRHLIDTVAAKDTVRQWLWDTYRKPCYPIEISLVADGERRFRADSSHIPDAHDLRVTVSGIEWLAVATVGDGEWRDIEARQIPEDADPQQIGNEVADAVARRNVNVPVGYVAPVENLVPSKLEVVAPPPFAVAWTSDTKGEEA